MSAVLFFEELAIPPETEASLNSFGTILMSYEKYVTKDLEQYQEDISFMVKQGGCDTEEQVCSDIYYCNPMESSHISSQMYCGTGHYTTLASSHILGCDQVRYHKLRKV